MRLGVYQAFAAWTGFYCLQQVDTQSNDAKNDRPFYEDVADELRAARAAYLSKYEYDLDGKHVTSYFSSNSRVESSDTIYYDNAPETDYFSIIPDTYPNKSAMVEYAFTYNLNFCGSCPCLCVCLPNSISCCLNEVLSDKNCRDCSYPDGTCDKCKKNYSLNTQKVCALNPRCKHSENGVCVRCKENYSVNSSQKCDYNPRCTKKEKGRCVSCTNNYSISESKFLCFRNPRCLSKSENGFCNQCDDGFVLDKDRKCIAETATPTLRM